MRALVLAAFAAAASACLTPVEGGDCRSDSDCRAGVCTRVGECATQVYALRVAWTVNGLPANGAGVCASVADLSVAVSDPSTGVQHEVLPVPCNSGSFFYDKLPLGYTEVAVTAFGTGGGFLTSVHASSIGSGGTVVVDLVF